ncbi:hypothetical protein ACTXT7_010526 [Hymenolepis weldensis]
MENQVTRLNCVFKSEIMKNESQVKLKATTILALKSAQLELKRMHKHEPWRSQSFEPYSEKRMISTKKKSSRCLIYLENFQSDLENEGTSLVKCPSRRMDDSRIRDLQPYRKRENVPYLKAKPTRRANFAEKCQDEDEIMENVPLTLYTKMTTKDGLISEKSKRRQSSPGENNG